MSDKYKLVKRPCYMIIGEGDHGMPEIWFQDSIGAAIEFVNENVPAGKSRIIEVPQISCVYQPELVPDNLVAFAAVSKEIDKDAN